MSDSEWLKRRTQHMPTPTRVIFTNTSMSGATLKLEALERGGLLLSVHVSENSRRKENLWWITLHDHQIEPLADAIDRYLAERDG
jgi:hypothetical protein